MKRPEVRGFSSIFRVPSAWRVKYRNPSGVPRSMVPSERRARSRWSSKSGPFTVKPE